MGASYSFMTRDDGRVTFVIEYTSADVTGEITFPDLTTLDVAHDAPECAHGRRHWDPDTWREWAERHGGHVDWLKQAGDGYEDTVPDTLPGWGPTRPDDIDTTALALSEAVVHAARKVLGREPDGCGCVTFYTPKQWAERGEEYGLKSDLIIVHDGGDFAPLLNLDYECYKLVDQFDKELRAALGDQILLEPCTCWYTSLTVLP